MSQYIKQAVFLVGGKGTRLGALTALTPKPLLEIAPGKRFLDHILAEAARHGFTDIILLAGHLGEQVEALYHGKRFLDATVTVIREPEPQGTGGALRFAKDRLDQWFLMGNGDSLFEINLRALTRSPRLGMKARLALREVPDPGRYGAVDLQGDTIVGFHEKSPDLAGPRPINGGLYLLNRDVVDMITGPCSIEQDIFPKLVEEGSIDGLVFKNYFLDIGLPDTYATACAEIPQRANRPIAFLDRDGVLNRDAGYTHRIEDLQWMPGAREAVRMLNDANYYTIIVSNQAGIARGYYGHDDVLHFHHAMQKDLFDFGAHIDGIYFCPFHPDATVEAYRIANHPDRKPNPGMLLSAMSAWPHVKDGSFLVGDRQSDVEAATNAGIPGYLFDGADLLVTIQAALTKSRMETHHV
jgi:D,D-heptose 1,7-bisphosphate phosphatase